MVHPTSAKAYQDILSSGLLGEWHRKVVRALIDKGPSTGRELDVHLGHDTAHKRPSELEAMGVVRKHSTRLCRVTGREAIAWELTGQKPIKNVAKAPPTPKTADIETFLKEIRPLLAGQVFVQPGTQKVLEYLEYRAGNIPDSPVTEEEDEDGGILDLFG